ncbi:MAG: calcium/sodium antiporter [Granulosicoccus sp.]
MLNFSLAIAGGCLGLYFGGDLLLRGATELGRRLGWSAAVIGFVLVSLGTSAPELFVSVQAAIQGYGDIAAGNVVGSNIVNIAVVLGLGALIFPLAVNESVRRHQLPSMLVVTMVGFFFLLDGLVTRTEGIVLVAAAFASVWWAMRVDGLIDVVDAVSNETSESIEQTLLQTLGFVVGGVLLLVLGAEGLIWGGVGLAAYFGVPEAVIALTVTSVGTGLPEITATILAVLRKSADLAIGNVVGSNLLNLGLVLGVSSIIAPISSGGVEMLPLSVMLVLTFLLGGLAWRPARINRWVGGGLLVGFIAYTVLLVR